MSAKKERPGVMLYFDQCRAMEDLTAEQRGNLLSAILQYAETGKEPELDGVTRLCFRFLQPGLDRDARRYGEVRARRRWASHCAASKRRGLEPLSFRAWCKQEGEPYGDDDEE